MTDQKEALDQSLGIPADARTVLVFGETSHWDPNWLHTSEHYYERRIEPIVSQVIDELVAEPRRIFSLESLFFLRLYWERNPDKRALLRELLNSGRLQLTGTGVTTPDTVLPHTEAILRDYLHGQQWLRQNGITVEPKLAYLPDGFGHSPALPSILKALGLTMAGVTRIDGMYFVGTDYRPKSAFPLAGSSAEKLAKIHRTLDFVWQSPDGAEVLCHWNAFTYFQGDMLAHKGIIRWMGKPLSFPWRSDRHVARKIRRFAKQLGPVSRTRYLFCPIGCDFTGPIHHLVDLLDRYNRKRYPKTGIWTVAASMEHYLRLVEQTGVELPALGLDPNPYWMGFYASRPELKHRCNQITRRLILAEKLMAFPPKEAAWSDGKSKTSDAETRAKIDRAWDLTVISNHHDFITGTSPDRVFEQEQEPWVSEAEELAGHALSEAQRAYPKDRREELCRAAKSCRRHEVFPVRNSEPPDHTMENGRLRVVASHFSMELDERAGGCITSLRDLRDDREILTSPANDLIAYRCSGGLWRMGHEYVGGSFRELQRTSETEARIDVSQKRAALHIRVESTLEQRKVTRHLWVERESPFVRMQAFGAAAPRVTVACRFPTVFDADGLFMDVPGGVATRPRHKLYDPTYWPARSFAHLRDKTSGRGLAAVMGGPACISLHHDGALEWVVFRNVHRERAFRFLPLLSHPASGTSPHEHEFDYAVRLTSTDSESEGSLAAQAHRALMKAGSDEMAELAPLADTLVETDRAEVSVTTIKRADHGEGIIVRLFSLTPPANAVKLHCHAAPIERAFLCDAMERDLFQLDVRDGEAELLPDGYVCSVRLILRF
jgi:hypothetical protein